MRTFIRGVVLSALIFLVSTQVLFAATTQTSSLPSVKHIVTTSISVAQNVSEDLGAQVGEAGSSVIQIIFKNAFNAFKNMFKKSESSSVEPVPSSTPVKKAETTSTIQVQKQVVTPPQPSAEQKIISQKPQSVVLSNDAIAAAPALAKTDALQNAKIARLQQTVSDLSLQVNALTVSSQSVRPINAAVPNPTPDLNKYLDSLSFSFARVLSTNPVTTVVSSGGSGGVDLTAFSANSPLSYNSSIGKFSLAKASSTADGYLSATDFATFTSNASKWTQSGSDIYRTTGNVGIGTTTPGTKLSVVGEVSATNFTAATTTGTSTLPNILTTNIRASNARFLNVTLPNVTASRILKVGASGDVTSGQVNLASNNEVSSVLQVSNGGTGSGALTQGSVVFAGSGGQYTQSSGLYYDSSNKYLGVGTSTPAYNLHVISDNATTVSTPIILTADLIPVTLPDAPSTASAVATTPNMGIATGMTANAGYGSGGYSATAQTISYKVYQGFTPDGGATVTLSPYESATFSYTDTVNDSSPFYTYLSWSPTSGYQSANFFVVYRDTGSGWTDYVAFSDPSFTVFNDDNTAWTTGTYTPSNGYFADFYETGDYIYSAYGFDVFSGTTVYSQNHYDYSFNDPHNGQPYMISHSLNIGSLQNVRILKNGASHLDFTSASVSINFAEDSTQFTGGSTVTPNTFGYQANGSNLNHYYDLYGYQMTANGPLYSQNSTQVSINDPSDGNYYYVNFTFNTASGKLLKDGTSGKFINSTAFNDDGNVVFSDGTTVTPNSYYQTAGYLKVTSSVSTSTPILILDNGNNSGSDYTNLSFRRNGIQSGSIGMYANVMQFTAGQYSWFNQTSSTPLMTLSSTGNLGIGTNTPTNKLHVKVDSADGGIVLDAINSGISPGIQFNSNGSVSYGGLGMARATADFGANTIANDISLFSQRGGDVHIATDASTGNPATRFIVKNGGNVGIGTTTPGQALVVVGNAQFTAVGSAASANDLRITSTGILTTNTSDARLKDNVVELATSTLDKVLKLRAVSYTWKYSSSTDRDIGLIAQETAEIFPEITFTNPTDGYMGINYSRLPAILIKAMQELNAKVEAMVIATKNAVFETLKIGSSEKPAGITLFDEVTGEPYCLKVRNGQQLVSAGECGLAATSSVPALSPSLPPADQSGDTGTSTNATSSDPSSASLSPSTPANEETAATSTDSQTPVAPEVVPSDSTTNPPASEGASGASGGAIGV